MAKVRLLVTAEKFDEVFSIDDWFNIDKIPQNVLYAKMLEFVVDEEDKPVTTEQAREMFKGVPRKEWMSYVSDFMSAVSNAFVNPTSGGS
jgi:hypothetical protein